MGSREKTEDCTQQNDCLFNNVDFSIMSPLQTLYGSIQKVESPPFCSAPLVLGKQTNFECELQRNLPFSLQSPQRPQVWRVLVWDGASHLPVGLGSHQESPDHRPRSLHRFWVFPRGDAE